MEQQQKNKFEKLYADISGQRIQLELLFSTGAIIGLLALPNSIENEVITWTKKTEYAGTLFVKILGFMMSGGVNILIFGFGLNIFFRALSLCYTTIDYIFPEGIEIDSWKTSNIYKSIINKDLDKKNWITNSEEYAGISFALSILIAVRFLGLFFLIWVFIYLLKLIGLDIFKFSDAKVAGNYIDMILLVAVLIMFRLPELIIFKFLRKYEWVAKIYKPFYYVFNFITLGFLEARQSVLIRQQMGILKGTLLIISFVFVGMYTSPDRIRGFKNKLDSREFLTVSRNGRFYVLNDNYDDELGKDNFVALASINSRFIEKNYINVFILYYKLIDKDLNKIYVPNDTIDSQSNRDLQYEESQKRLDAFAKFVDLTIDDSIKMPKQKWLLTKHPVTNELGFTTILDIEKVQNGNHNLNIVLNYNPSDKNYLENKTKNPFDVNISFYKSVVKN